MRTQQSANWNRNDFLFFISHPIYGFMLQQARHTKMAGHSKFYAQKRHDDNTAGRRLGEESWLVRGFIAVI